MTPRDHRVLIRVSPGYPRPWGMLETHYSPFRHSTRRASSPFAFDLHVLAMPPAFNLSQDQTLQFRNRCLPHPQARPRRPRFAEGGLNTWSRTRRSTDMLRSKVQPGYPDTSSGPVAARLASHAASPVGLPASKGSNPSTHLTRMSELSQGCEPACS